MVISFLYYRESKHFTDEGFGNKRETLGPQREARSVHLQNAIAITRMFRGFLGTRAKTRPFFVELVHLSLPGAVMQEYITYIYTASDFGVTCRLLQ